MTAKDNSVLERESQDLIELTRTSGDALGRAVTAVIAQSSPKGARIPSIAAALDLLAAALESGVQEATQAQAALVAERADDGPLLARRDLQSHALAQQLVDGRAAVAGAFGADAPAQLGFAGATPSNDPRAIVKLARAVSQRASKVKLTPARKGVKIDVAVLFEDLAANASALEATLGEIAREGREETEALVKRDLALAAARDRRIGLASVLRGLYTFVGDHERAQRVFDAVERASAADSPAPPADDKR